VEFHPQVAVQQCHRAAVGSGHFALLVIVATERVVIHRHPICKHEKYQVKTTLCKLIIKRLQTAALPQLKLKKAGQYTSTKKAQLTFHSLVVEQSELLPSGDADSSTNSSKGAPPVRDQDDKLS